MEKNWLLELLLLAGKKLPLIWPYVMHILEDLKKIAEILNSGSVVIYSSTDYSVVLDNVLSPYESEIKSQFNLSDDDYNKAKSDLLAVLSTLDKVKVDNDVDN